MIPSHNVVPFKACEVTNCKFPVGDSGLGNKLVVYCSPQLRAAAVLHDLVAVTPISSQLRSNRVMMMTVHGNCDKN